MKILFCIDNMTKGGAERVIANLSNMFAKKNDDIYILTLLKGDSSYQLDNRIHFDSLQIKEGKKNIFEKIFYTLKNVVDMRRYIKKNNFDIMISFLPRASWYSAIATRSINTKLIISERNDPASIYKSTFQRKMYRLIYNMANGVVFQTNDAKAFFSKKVQRDSVVISNPVNDIFFDCKNVKERKKTIVNVGRLSEQKNHKLLINAFADFSNKYPDYKLIIYGEGPLRNELEKQIADLKLNNKILLPGIVDNIKDKIYDSSMFVFTSDYEGMPNSLMEAMTLGIPCISTDCPCGGPREIIDDGINGILVPVNDKDMIVASMKKIIEDDLLDSFSENAKKKMKDYKIDIINKKWKEYIDFIIGRK